MPFDTSEENPQSKDESLMDSQRAAFAQNGDQLMWADLIKPGGQFAIRELAHLMQQPILRSWKELKRMCWHFGGVLEEVLVALRGLLAEVPGDGQSRQWSSGRQDG